MNYMPAVTSMDRLDGGPLGPDHHVVFCGNVRAAGRISYRYLLIVYHRESEKPVYIVASEVNGMAAETGGGGSHFLGVFDGNGHLNFGASDEWADADKFLPRAIAMAAAHVGLRPADDGDAPVAGFRP